MLYTFPHHWCAKFQHWCCMSRITAYKDPYINAKILFRNKLFSIPVPSGKNKTPQRHKIVFKHFQKFWLKNSHENIILKIIMSLKWSTRKVITNINFLKFCVRYIFFYMLTYDQVWYFKTFPVLFPSKLLIRCRHTPFTAYGFIHRHIGFNKMM